MKKIGIGIGVVASGGENLDDVVEKFVRAEEAGFQSAWIPNIFGYDALTVSALAGRKTRRIEIGTAVVPTHSRHPFYMAQQALTTAAACGGRFVLGLGPSHKVVIWGSIDFDCKAMVYLKGISLLHCVPFFFANWPFVGMPSGGVACVVFDTPFAKFFLISR